MAIDKQDRRVVRSREKLATALIQLTIEQGYEAVTIRQITERAGVGYATFFRHYPDKGALLLDALDIFVAELVALVQQPPSDDGVQTGTLLFNYVKQNENLSRVFLLSRSNAALMQRLHAAGIQSVLVTLVAREDGIVSPELAAFHIVSASIALIQWWLEHDMPYLPERMGIIYDALILQPTVQLAFARSLDRDE